MSDKKNNQKTRGKHAARTGTPKRAKQMSGVKKSSAGKERAEQAHLKTEERFRALIETASDWIWEVDEHVVYTYTSPRVKDLLGYEPEEIIGRTPFDFMPPEEARRVAEDFDACVKARRPLVRLENINLHKDGHHVVLETSGVPLVDAEGHLMGYRGIDRDITVRKQMEEALRESEQRLRILFEAAPDAIFLQSGGRFIYLNRKIVELFGATTAEELIGREMFDRFAPESHEVIRQRISRMRETGQSVPLSEQVYLRMDGSRVPVETAAVNLQLEGRDVFVVFVRDITDRKKAEEKLRQREEIFRTIIETEPECVKIIDKDGRLVMMNPAGLAMIEADSLDMVRGQQVSGLVAPEYRDAFSRMVRDVFEGNTGKLVFEMTGLKGARRWLDTISVPLRDPAGAVTALLGVTRDVTEYKRIEQALQESERKYRELVENANSIILKWDTEGRVTFFNEYAQRFFGFTAEEILGKNVVGTIVPATESSGRDLEQFMRDICADPDRFQDNENENITKDGRKVWIRWKNRAVLNEKGELAGVLSIGTNETERRAMFAATQESEKRMRLAMAVSRQGFFEIDVLTGEVMVSPEYARMMGYEPGEYPPMHMKWHDLLAPDDRAAAVRAFEEYLTGRRDDFRIEFRQQTKSGQSRWILAVGTITGWDHDGNPVRLLGTLSDITERRLAEEKVVQSEQLTKNMLETVDEGFVVIDRDYRILVANNAYRRQAGMKDEEVVGKYCYVVSHKTMRPCFEEGEDCAVRHVFETGVPYRSVHRHQDAEGTVLYVETKAFPLTDVGGRITSVIETVSNMTERYLLEEERLKTQKLEAIGTLAGGIAHDFNNLLQGVFGFVSMAKMVLDRKEKALEMLEQAERALHMSVNLTTQLLTFSKGGKPIKKRIVLRPVIENAVKFSLSGSRSDYRLDIAEDLMAVNADEGQISQVLQNIVLNADQSMPEGGTVIIQARNVRFPEALLSANAERGDSVAITISDSGIGIPEKYLSKIFDPYFTTKEKGRGLGLATSFSIIRNHDGIIDAKSEVGRGSEFTIYLPAAAKGVEEVSVRPVSVAARKGRILLMDDEEMIRTVAGELLRALGHDVALAKDGREAIDRYREARESGNPFDVVILDLTIRGGMGGDEAVKGILEIDPDAKAVVSSGYADSDVVSRYRAYGFCGTLSKPYTIASLKTILDELLK